MTDEFRNILLCYLHNKLYNCTLLEYLVPTKYWKKDQVVEEICFEYIDNCNRLCRMPVDWALRWHNTVKWGEPKGVVSSDPNKCICPQEKLICSLCKNLNECRRCLGFR